VSELEALHLTPQVAARLALAGWTAEHHAVRAAAPVAARGTNLVVASPPAPGWAGPALAGLLSRRGAEAGPGLTVVLCPSESLEEWARLVSFLATGTPLRLGAAQTPGRLTRLLRSDAADLILTSPDNAEELIRRATLKMEGVGAVVLVWPERWPDAGAITRLIADLPTESQRLLITADPVTAGPLIERYAWRAPVADLLGPAPDGDAPQVRSTPVSWRGRIAALAELVEQLDPESCAVWSADTRDHDAIRSALTAAGAGAEVTTGIPAPASLILAYDLPAPAALRQLAAAGETVLLVPPGTETYASRIAPRRRPIHLLGALDRARTELESARREVAALLDREPDALGFLGVAPLLERYEAPAVAAALWQLWRARPAPAAAAPAARPPSSVRLWIGAGKRDEVGQGDVMAALTRYAAVPREAIGKIEIRESFTLVELGSGVDAEAVAEKVTGRSIGKRRLVARVDRGRAPGKPRPGMPPRPPR
jgi:hypothetical protein